MQYIVWYPLCDHVLFNHKFLFDILLSEIKIEFSSSLSDKNKFNNFMIHGLWCNNSIHQKLFMYDERKLFVGVNA